MARREMRHYGWGDPAHASHGLPQGALELLRARVGLADVPRLPVPVGSIALPAAVEFDVPGVELRSDQEARVLRAAGKSYPDVFRMRTGIVENAPDAVAVPRSADEVRAVLGAGVAVVPFGGGTSVVGGVEALRGEHPAVVSLDLGLLDRLVELDERSQVAVFEPGIQLPAAEGALNARGFTLGHFPQSYEYATVGGCVATRSAGQASTGYGRIDAMVVGLQAVCPAGDVELLTVPASAAGPDLRELLVGSEGALGVLTRVALRVRRLPAERRYEGFMFASFEQGVEAFRALEQEGAAPHVARLSDVAETRGLVCDGGARGRRRRSRRPVPAGAGSRGWLPGDLRLGGDAGRRRGAARGVDLGAARPRRRAAGALPGPRLVTQPLRRPLPARRPDGARRDGRDARDGHDVVEPRPALPRRAGTRCARTRRSSCAM